MIAKCSIVVPVYNVAPFLGQCVNSLTTQTMPELEIILVDDGSRDESGALCDEWAARDERVRVIHQENAGVSVARNAGVAVAQAPWVAFVDGDDWLEPDALEKCFAALTSEVDVMLYGLCRVIGEKRIYFSDQTNDIVDWKGVEIEKLALGVLDRFAYASPEHPKLHVSTIFSIFRKSFLLDCGVQFKAGFRFHEDWLYKLQVYQKAQHVRYLDTPLYDYRINIDSVMHAYRPNVTSISSEELTSIWNEEIASLGPVFQKAFYRKVALAFIDSVLLDYCNKNNPQSYSCRKQAFIEGLATEPFKQAFLLAVNERFPLKYKVVYWAMKYKQFLLLDILTRFFD